MKMVEQNISGVKLERLRQNAVKKHKILRKLFPRRSFNFVEDRLC